jgi:hypothetical protein
LTRFFPAAALVEPHARRHALGQRPHRFGRVCGAGLGACAENALIFFINLSIKRVKLLWLKSVDYTMSAENGINKG